MVKHGNIPVKVFYTPKGERTCAIGPDADHTCRFYGTSHFGTIEFCTVSSTDKLCRSGDAATGYLEIAQDCPIEVIE